VSRSHAEDIAAAITDRRIASTIKTIEDAAGLAAALARMFRFDELCAFLIARTLWDRSKKLRAPQ
jgi:hypothetical protein